MRAALTSIDRVLSPVTWIAAGLLVLMLFIGPKVIADDKLKPPTGEAAGAAPYSTGGGQAKQPAAAPDGKKVFTDNCGSCHTLSAAGTTGNVGPKLDGAGVDVATVTTFVTNGAGVMPSFKGKLSDAQIKAVASFVAQASGG